MRSLFFLALMLLCDNSSTFGIQTPAIQTTASSNRASPSTSLYPSSMARPADFLHSPTTLRSNPGSSVPLTEWQKPSRFSVKLGAVGIINLYGLYYGLTSIFLGLIWTVANFFTWLTYKFTWNILLLKNFDKGRRISVFLAHVWGVWLMRLTRCYPIIESRDSAPTPVKYFQKSMPTVSPSVMYVANHCSWMDIPFMGAAIGWRNYKIVAKKELTKVRGLGWGWRDEEERSDELNKNKLQEKFPSSPSRLLII